MSTRAAGDPPEPGPRRRALAALCVTEIVSYGVIYYAFPVLASQITAGTGSRLVAISCPASGKKLAALMLATAGLSQPPASSRSPAWAAAAGEGALAWPWSPGGAS